VTPRLISFGVTPSLGEKMSEVRRTYIVPFKEMRFEDILRARQEAQNLLVEAIRARGKKPEEYVIRDILPKTDLGLANEEWRISYTAAYTWETKINVSLPEDKFIVIYGVAVYSATPKTTAIKFYKDVTPIQVIEIEKLYAYSERIGFFTPLVWSESETLKVEFYGNAAGDDNIVLLGFAAEKRRKTIA
jgi:hypothetical protein